MDRKTYVLPQDYTALTPADRRKVREQYVREQGDICAYCGGDLKKEPKDVRAVNKRLFPEGFFQHPVHLHHDHDTGLTLGAVHAHCNAVSWQYDGV